MNLLAQNLDAIAGKGGTIVFSNNNSITIITWLIPYVFYMSSFLLLIYLLTGGLQMMMAKGDPKAMAGAWAKITNAVIGFIIIFLAYFLTTLLGEVFGFKGFGGVFN
jgi:hypothetical protein